MASDGSLSEFTNLPAGTHPLGPVATRTHVWFTDPVNACVYRFSLRGELVTQNPHGTGAPRAITSGPDGSIWFVLAEGNAVGVIRTDGRISEYSLGNDDSSPRGLFYAKGSLWVTLNKTNQILRMQPSGRIRERIDIPTANSGPRALLLHTNGRLYFSEYDAAQIGELAI